MWNTKADVTCRASDDYSSFIFFSSHSVSSNGVLSHVENLKAENERKLADLIFGLLNKLYTLKRLALANIRHRIPHVIRRAVCNPSNDSYSYAPASSV